MGKMAILGIYAYRYDLYSNIADRIPGVRTHHPMCSVLRLLLLDILDLGLRVR